MGKNPEVDAWFAEKRLASEAAMQRVRELILAADPRVEEFIQYATLQFAYEGVIASVVQAREKRVNLMFNRGARIEGDFAHLEGDGPSARFMRFADLAEVEARADELQAVVRAWCELVGPA